MLEHLSIYTYLFGGITFSISMYIMCVCLFSALSRRVGALQISIIIIIILDVQAVRGYDQGMYLMYKQSGALAMKCT